MRQMVIPKEMKIRVPPSRIWCCIGCGRDTYAKDRICNQCRPRYREYTYAADDRCTTIAPFKAVQPEAFE